MHLHVEISNPPPVISYFDRKIAIYFLRII